MIAVATISRIKRTAKLMRKDLAAHEVNASHGRCLEAIAAGLGFGSFAALSTAIEWDAEAFDPKRCAARLAELHGIPNDLSPIAAVWAAIGEGAGR